MLKQALAANALFSATSGLVLIAARGALAAEIPAPPWLFVALGIGLLGFAVQLAAMVLRPALARRLALAVVASDVGWVVVTSAALAVFYARVSTPGIALIVAVNAVVAVFALVQYRAFARSRSVA